jgi:hypothetical protein
MVRVTKDKIIIRTEKDAQKLEAGMAQIQIEYTPFVVHTLTTLINQLIIDPIQKKMRDANISPKVIDRTYLDVHAEKQGETIIFHIKSDYISDTGFAVAKMIEYGRRAYLIKPKRKKLLSWIKDGKRRFAKQVRMPRKQAGNYIFDGIKRGQPKVQAELNKLTRKWISENLK